MTAHELGRQLLAARDLEVQFSKFDGPYGFLVWGSPKQKVVHEVIEHDEPEDFIEIMLHGGQSK